MTRTFDPAAFTKLKAAEERHFWFRIRRRWITDRIARFVPPPARVLEVGCGSGNVGAHLSRKGYRVTGSELYADALEMAWSGFDKVRSDAVDLPFDDGAFDVVGLFDVIEHLDDDLPPLREAFRVLKREGIVIVTVPARRELWSHVDVLSFHRRRYVPALLRRLFSQLGAREEALEYMFASLYLPMMLGRRKSREKVPNQLDIGPLANLCFQTLCDTERRISRRAPFPIGTSLIAVYRKAL